MENDLVFKKIDLTVKDFHKLMEEIDEILSKASVPIHARPIRAIPEIVKRLKVNILIAPSQPITSPNIFNTHNMATHVNEWYDSKYGDRLKKHFGPGRVAIILKREPWKIYLPRVYGRVRLVCDPDIEKYRNVPQMSVGGSPAILNILTCIENMTSGFAHTLSRDDDVILMKFFAMAMDSFHCLEKIKAKPFIREVFSDLNSAVSHMFSSPPHYGQSKWSTSQVAEKLLKCYLKTKGIKFPRNHNLELLANMAKENDIINIGNNVIKQIECSPGVRYGECEVVLEEAILAHHTSLTLACVIGRKITG